MDGLKSRTRCRGDLPEAFVERAPERLAVDRDDTLEVAREIPQKAPHHRLKTLGIKPVEQVRKRAMAGNAVLQHHDPAQKLFFRAPEQRHVVTALAAAKHAQQRDHQHLMQIMACRVTAARVANALE